MRLNLGCGADYRKGWVNADFNKEVKADVYCDLTKKLPFKDNEFRYILMDNVLEHIPTDSFFKFTEELHRILSPGGIVEIYVPHYSGMYAFKHLGHYRYFGVGSMDLFRPEPIFNGERYSKARFKLIDEKLMFFHHNLDSMKFLSKLPINWMFNFGRTWRLLMEKFFFPGFDEIKYILRKV
jgi:SAM-dependent methyltransferase